MSVLSSVTLPRVVRSLQESSSSSIDVNSKTEANKSVFTLADLQTLNDLMAIRLVPVIVVIGALIILGIIGNLLVCYTFSCRKKNSYFERKLTIREERLQKETPGRRARLKVNTQHFFILCLAVFDLITCAVAMPTEIADMVFFYTFSSEVACKTLRFITSLTTFSSIFTLIAIAVDRFRKICRPHDPQLTLHCARMSLGLVLALTVVCSWPTPVIYGIASVDVGYSPIMGNDCTINDEVKNTVIPLAFNILMLFGFVTLTTIIIVLYTLILCGLRRHTRTMRTCKLEMTSSSHIKPKKPFCRLTVEQALVTSDAAQSRLNSIEPENTDNFLKQKHGITSDGSYCPRDGNSEPSTRDKRLDILVATSSSDLYVGVTTEVQSATPTTLKELDLDKQISSTSSGDSNSSGQTLILSLSTSHIHDTDFTSNMTNSGEHNSSNRQQIQTYSQTKTQQITHTTSATSGPRPKNISSKTTKIAFLITVVFILSYLPHLIIQAIKFAHDLPEGEGDMLVLSNLIVRSYFINSVANPIIYGLFNMQFRHEVANLVRFSCCRRSSGTPRSSL